MLSLNRQIDDPSILHKWYGDDGNAAGSFGNFLIFEGFGYDVKCHFILKRKHLNKARKAFVKCIVQLLEGHPVLGSVLGTPTSFSQFIEQNIHQFDEKT